MTHLLHRIQSSHSQKRKVAWNKALAQHFDHTTNWKRTRGKAFFSGGCGFSRHKITNRATYRKDRKRPHASATPWSITTFLESPTSCNSCKSCEVRPFTCSGMQKSLRRQGWEIFRGKDVPVVGKGMTLGIEYAEGRSRCLGAKLFFFSLKTFLSFTDGENRLVVALGEGVEGGMEWEVGVSRCKLLRAKAIHNKILLYSTKNHIQHPNSSGKIF